MRFIHLSEQSNIAKIRQTGIRMGDGRRGRGVYAVPMAMLEYRLFTDEQLELTSLSASRTSSQLWKWLPKQRNKNANIAAFVFELPTACWPVDLYLEVNPDIGTGLLAWIDDAKNANITLTSENREYVAAACNNGFLSDLHLQVTNHQALGISLTKYRKLGRSFWSTFDDRLEVVIRKPIPKTSIKKVFALYKRNLERKSKISSSKRKHSHLHDED